MKLGKRLSRGLELSICLLALGAALFPLLRWGAVSLKVGNAEHSAWILALQTSQHSIAVAALCALGTTVLAGLAAFFAVMSPPRLYTSFLTLSALPLFLPPLLSVVAVVALWGRHGAISLLGVRLPSVYSSWGVFLGALMLNFAISYSVLFLGFRSIFSRGERLGAALLKTPSWRLRHLIIPSIWPPLCMSLLFIFVYMVFSFTLPLSFSSGRGGSFFEVVIYKEILFFRRPFSAWVLGVAELTLASSVIAVFLVSDAKTARLKDVFLRAHFSKRLQALFAGLTYCIIFLCIGAPIVSLLWPLAHAPAHLHALLFREWWQSLGASLGYGTAAALIVVPISLAVAYRGAYRSAPPSVLTRALLYVPLSVSPVLLSLSFRVSAVSWIMLPLFYAFFTFPFCARLAQDLLRPLSAGEVALRQVFYGHAPIGFLRVDLPLTIKGYAPLVLFPIVFSLSDLSLSMLLGARALSPFLFGLFSSYQYSGALIFSFLSIIVVGVGALLLWELVRLILFCSLP